MSAGRVLRHGQESIASLCGSSGFGAVPSHNDVCRRLGAVATDPVSAIIEYIKRDIANIANIALGNRDNHARNTAIWRRPDGTISLTALFDFAPMWLHPDGIARRIRWQADDGDAPDWASVITQACDTAKVDHASVKAGVQMMAPPLGTLLADALALGIDEQFLTPLQKSMEPVRQQLEKL